MKHQKLKHLFRKYLSGKVDPEERNLVESWYDRLENRPSVQLSESEEQHLEEEIWQKMAPLLHRQHTARLRYIYMGLAASIAILIFAGIIYYNQHRAPKERLYQEYVTGTGERKKITLPDGTVITLNSGTHMRIPEDYPASREIELTEGEAFFEVHHDPAHPFIIHTDTITTTVLGTAFNIRSYQHLQNFSVAVVEGKVQVANPRQSLASLEQQQRLVLNRESNTWAVTSFNEATMGWKSGKLVLDNETFKDVALLLQSNYGIHLIGTNNTITNKKFTASLPLSLTGKKAAEVLAAIYQFKIGERRDTITIYH